MLSTNWEMNENLKQIDNKNNGVHSEFELV
jgi:hypothetical protein